MGTNQLRILSLFAALLAASAHAGESRRSAQSRSVGGIMASRLGGSAIVGAASIWMNRTPLQASERIGHVAALADGIKQPIVDAAAGQAVPDEALSAAGHDLEQMRVADNGASPVDGSGPAAGYFYKDPIKEGKTISADFRREVGRIIVGHPKAVELALVGLLVKRGNVLFESVPGLGKTLLVKTVAAVSGLNHGRIQLTTDMRPEQIGGYRDPETGKIIWGPVTKYQLLHIDEINRGTPKSKSAILEPFQELQVSIDNEKKLLPDPFSAIATMNPIDTEGVFPMLEPEKDRFLISHYMGYNTEEEELRVAAEQSANKEVELKAVLSEALIKKLRKLIAQIHVAPEVRRYSGWIVRGTRPPAQVVPDDEENPEAATSQPEPFIDLKGYVKLGASPRGAIAMLQVARVFAWEAGRDFVNVEDIRRAAIPVLRHRIIMSASGRAAGKIPEQIISQILKETPIPKS